MNCTIRPWMTLSLALCAAILSSACSFKSPAAADTPSNFYLILNTAPYASPSSSDRWIVSHDDGSGFRTDHGFSCARADRAASRDHLGIRVLEQAEVPEGWEATVFLNGWTAHYDGEDNHVKGLGTVLFNVRLADNLLTWDAGGLLSDKKGDDAFKWCYNYTIVYWSTVSNDFDIRATHSDPTGKLLFIEAPMPPFAVHSIPGSFAAVAGKQPRAALPAGFALAWHGSDHHISQLGFEMGPQSKNGSTLSWTSTAVLKDNAKSRAYRAAEAVTMLSGRGITLTEPAEVLRLESDVWVPKPNSLDFTPLPKSSCPNVQIGGQATKVWTYSITGLTADYAMPVLSGFELAFDCDDQHIRNSGARIVDFSYQPPVAGQPGTLVYQVETQLTDNDKIPEMNDRVEVSVLGIDRL